MQGRIPRNYDTQRQLEELLQSAAVETSSHWQSSASALPQANSYKTKVAQRIHGSESLSNKTHLKQKLFKLADEKLENCKKPNGQELDRQCVGRTTGQIMQLIAAVENVSRQTPNGSNRRSQSMNDY